MKIFNTLCLEISAQCNRKCKFCPVAYNTRPSDLLDWGLVTKAVQELEQINYKGRVEFYIYNEPLKEKEYLKDCIKIFRDLVPRSCLMVATNGDYFKNKTARQEITELFDIGLNQLLINCYSPGLYEKRKKWLEGDWIVDGPMYNYVSPKKRVIQLLDKSNEEDFGSGVFRLVNRAGNLEGYIPAVKEPLKRMCVKPFRLLNVNWEGDGMICCQDYHGSVPLGNLANTTLLEMWNHPIINRYRKQLLKKDRSLPLCNACDCYAGAYPSNVDKDFGKCASIESINQLYESRTSKDK